MMILIQAISMILKTVILSKNFKIHIKIFQYLLSKVKIMIIYTSTIYVYFSRDASTLERSSDVLIEQTGKTLSVSSGLSLKTAEIHFNYYLVTKKKLRFNLH